MLKRFLQRWLGIQELSDRQTRLTRNARRTRTLANATHQDYMAHLEEFHNVRFSAPDEPADSAVEVPSESPAEPEDLVKGYERL